MSFGIQMRHASFYAAAPMASLLEMHLKYHLISKKLLIWVIYTKLSYCRLTFIFNLSLEYKYCTYASLRVCYVIAGLELKHLKYDITI